MLISIEMNRIGCVMGAPVVWSTAGLEAPGGGLEWLIAKVILIVVCLRGELFEDFGVRYSI